MAELLLKDVIVHDGEGRPESAKLAMCRRCGESYCDGGCSEDVGKEAIRGAR